MVFEDKADALSRRRLLAGGTAGVAALALTATGAAAVPEAETIPLWPGSPPGGGATLLTTRIEKRSPQVNVYSQIAAPLLLVYRPATPNGSAIVLAQGGGYVHIANSALVDAYFVAQGFTVFDLIYRLPAEGWKAGPDAPKQDVQRAVRLARKLAPQYGVEPNHIGVMGFSAGGHVAATAATTFQQKVYDPVDDADSLSARPDFAVLSCPAITMLDPFAHVGSRRLLLGEAPDATRAAAYSCEKLVTADTPSCFLVHADDDKVVPADNSILMTLALRRAGVAAELHLYREGGHGMGTGLAPELPASHWTEAMLRWVSRLAPAKP